uniref:ubiquitinyl hydrolase 1 n=1 Tax=Monopterus albus TaxID=43700 RepID=A0A3Q3JC55_MONAL
MEKRGYSSAVRLHGWNTPGVCGLDNSGNSCYFNAVLQCLCSTVPLVEHLLNKDTHKELCRVAQVFVRLLEEMWLGSSPSCAPVEARSVLCSILPQFNNYSQQDAQELLIFLLNALHDDLKKSQDQNKNCATAAGESTIVSHLFEGQLSYMRLCMHCEHQAHSTQSFTVLSLPIPTSTTKCSIQDCLSLFFEQTTLTGGEQMLCSVCRQRRETAVLTCLDKPPEILVLHLKRWVKQHHLFRVTFISHNLDKQMELCPEWLKGSNHTGSLNMGHYTALCHNTLTRAWHCFDDSAVREVQDNLVQSPNAYILLYTRKPFQKEKSTDVCSFCFHLPS